MPAMQPADLPTVSADQNDRELGERLRALRTARGLTLKDVAARAEMSIGAISQIERGVSSPSIRTLRGICHALGIDGAELFSPTPTPTPTPSSVSSSSSTPAPSSLSRSASADSQAAETSLPSNTPRAASLVDVPNTEYLVRAHHHKPLRLHGTGITKYRVTPASCNAMEAYLMELDPGASSDPNFLVQTGDKVGYVIEGKLQLFIGDESLLLEAGDTYGFPANKAYRWINGWDKKTRFLVVNSNHFYV